MVEPGLDLHDWETRWEQFLEDAEDSPAEALSEMDALLAEMLASRGYQIDEPVTTSGEEVEVVKQFFAAREITRLADAGDADPGDIADAIEGYRILFETITSEFAEP
ncbi:MAG: hypothetical protein QOE91_482 [Gaiellaceae bacterium]|jgi:hypothetical protein|nr:hypothetical protein [Gaiellaceae bacterium]